MAQDRRRPGFLTLCEAPGYELEMTCWLVGSTRQNAIYRTAARLVPGRQRVRRHRAGWRLHGHWRGNTRGNQSRGSQERHHYLGQWRVLFEEVYPLHGNLQVALVVARDQVPLLQIPQHKGQILEFSHEHALDVAH